MRAILNSTNTNHSVKSEDVISAQNSYIQQTAKQSHLRPAKQVHTIKKSSSFAYLKNLVIGAPQTKSLENELNSTSDNISSQTLPRSLTDPRTSLLNKPVNTLGKHSAAAVDLTVLNTGVFLIESEFLEWSCEYFAEPQMRVK